MERIRPGDRVWVKKPQLMVERKVGTVIGTKRTTEGVRYLVEWEVDLTEHRNGHSPGYRADEIAPIDKSDS